MCSLLKAFEPVECAQQRASECNRPVILEKERIMLWCICCDSHGKLLGAHQRIRDLHDFIKEKEILRDKRSVYAFLGSSEEAGIERMAMNDGHHIRPGKIDCTMHPRLDAQLPVRSEILPGWHIHLGDIIGRKLVPGEDVYSSIEYLFQAPALTAEKVAEIARGILANELIETVKVLSRAEVEKNGMPLNKPVVNGIGGGEVRLIDLEVSDDELMEISRKGTLALSLEEMKSIQNYFRNAKDRAKFGLDKPTDVELEILAQTWSEHCKHKIFSAEVEYLDRTTGKKETFTSLYKTFIQKGTKEIAKKVDWLVSVFTDNAGVIKFNDKLDLVFKVETHNSPSALDPYGGAMTGILTRSEETVSALKTTYQIEERDPLGLFVVWLGSDFEKNRDITARILDEVSGHADGFDSVVTSFGEHFHFSMLVCYIGKPLVYCGTLGTLPKKVGKVDGWTKTIKPGALRLDGLQRHL